MKRGFTKSWRKELESDIWLMPPIYHRVWFWIRQKAQHDIFIFPTRRLYGIWVLPGQRLTSIQEIATGCKWMDNHREMVPDKRTISRVLEWLEFNRCVTVTSNANGTIISIVNWDTYNVSESLPATVSVPGYVPPNVHKEECKRIKRKTLGEDEFVLPEWVPVEPWENFVKMRKSIKKPITDNARALAVDKLLKLKEAGNDPTDVLNQSTLNSWQGLFEVKKETPKPDQSWRQDKHDSRNFI